MKIISLIFIIIFSEALLLMSMEKQDEHFDKLIQKVKSLYFIEYSPEEYEGIKSFHKALSNSDKDFLTNYIHNNCNQSSSVNDCVNLIIIFGFNKDTYVLDSLKSIYSNCTDEGILAAIELYYYNIGYKAKQHFNIYLKRLQQIKNLDSNVLFVAILCDSTSGIIPFLLYIPKYRTLDGSGGELWYGVMSWVERNEEWLDEDNDKLLEKRMIEYKIK
jgi:hypothetical protein